MEEKRIYAVAAEIVDTPTRGTVVQIPGRLSAQLGHATSRMRMHRLAQFALNWVGARSRKHGLRDDLLEMADEAITTIHLSCRDSKELEHVMGLLRKRGVVFYDFHDINPAVYGPGEVRTAIATVPVRPKQVKGILDYLPLALKRD